MKGSDIVVEMLKHYRVEHIFGLPGDTSMALYDSLSRTDDIIHIMCRDERNAGFMADAYARVSGKPGVCEVPSGGGVTYLLPAIAEADGSSVPMVCLTSDVPLSSDEKSALTALDQTALLSPVSRFSHRLTGISMIPHIIRKAFRKAVSSPTGPAALVFPEDILSDKCDGFEPENRDLYAEESCAAYPAFRARPEAELVEKTARLLIQAERPLILAGGGVLLSGAEASLSGLLDHAAIPVITTINGKGSIRETSPLAFGVVGANGAKGASNIAAGEADLILAVGSRLNASITLTGKLLNRDAVLIQVDSDPGKLGNTARAEIAIQADARLFFEDLLSALKDYSKTPLQRSEWALNSAEKVAAEFAALEKVDDYFCAGTLHPARIIRTLDQILPPESIIVSDAGYSTPYASAYYRIKKEGRHFIDPRAQGGLGYALAAAVGAKYAAPQAPVAALFGDGSLGMNIGELETVARLKLPLILIHFRNDSFGWIENIQKIYYDRCYFSTGFDSAVDYARAAGAFGIEARRVESMAGFTGLLKSALSSDRAVFIEVPVPTGDQLTPLVAPWLADETLVPEDRCKSGY